MPNPSGSDTLEYVELINNSDVDINLKWCSLDDKIDWGSSKFIFLEDDFILKWKTKKYYKSLTALNFNNDNDEVNLFCNDELVDSLKRNFKVADWYYLDHNRLDIKSSNAKVLKVIDWDTIEVQFLDSLLIEKLRFIWVDTPETKHPDNELEKYWIEAFEFTKNNLLWKKILVEIDNDNFRDSYSRLLWYVILDSENFNQKLIRLWYAKAYLNYPFKYSVEFKNSEKEAKNENLWIWKEDKNILKNIFVDDIDILVEEEDKVNLDDENKNNIPDEFDESLIWDESNTWWLVINEEYLSWIIEYNNLSSLDTINISEKNILKSAINVQWKIWVNKVLNWNTLTCYETCSVNFDWSNSEWSIEKYSWDFWNWEFFDWINPWYIKYEKYWKYKINLKIIWIDWVEKDSIFYVNFLEKNNVAKEEKNNESFEIIPLSYSNNSTATKPIIQTQLENDDLSLNWWTTKVEILLYLLIFIFSLNLWVLILKREKLM
jgi:endonuclease YncB( thermonuclease family)